MEAQGPDNTIKVKLFILKCGPATSGDDYIHLLSYVLFSGHTALISGPKTAEIPCISSKMAAQGPENTIKVKVIISKCGPDTSGADYTRLLP